MRLVNVELLVESVAKHELVGHFHAEGLHRVARSIVDRTHASIVEVADLLV